METLKVSTKSNPNSVAGAMAGVLRQDGVVAVQVVGAGALNQAIKAVAITRGYVASTGIDVVCVPSFADIEIDGERRTAIRLTIEDRARPTGAPSINGQARESVDLPAPSEAGRTAGIPVDGGSPDSTSARAPAPVRPDTAGCVPSSGHYAAAMLAPAASIIFTTPGPQA